MLHIGIIGGADIAYRRFLPALKKVDGMVYWGVASRCFEKSQKFLDAFGGKIYKNYNELLADPQIDAVYLPLPPALHFEWGKRTLLSGKHLLMEKPFTTSLCDTQELLKLAHQKNLAVYENYMFLYHSQLQTIRDKIASGELGNIRLYRMEFGFPHRGMKDFRYSKALGGGALLDCGGYPIRLALELLGQDAYVSDSQITIPSGYDVDVYGCATVKNNNGETAQLSFGMDQTYRCTLDIWGSKASLTAPRIFTAPAEFAPPITINDHQEELVPDDAFYNSILRFIAAVKDPTIRALECKKIEKQSSLVQECICMDTK